MTGLGERRSGEAAVSPHPGSKRLWRVAFGVAMAVQVVVLYSPSSPSGPQINGLDKLVHICVFAAYVVWSRRQH